MRQNAKFRGKLVGNPAVERNDRTDLPDAGDFSKLRNIDGAHSPTYAEAVAKANLQLGGADHAHAKSYIHAGRALIGQPGPACRRAELSWRRRLIASPDEGNLPVAVHIGRKITAAVNQIGFRRRIVVVERAVFDLRQSGAVELAVVAQMNDEKLYRV